MVGIAENDVWFGGQGWSSTAGQPANLLVHYDGSSFEEIYLPLLENSEHKIRDLAALSGDQVWAVGSHGRTDSIGRMHVAQWDGSSWTYLDMPEIGIDEKLTAVAAIAPDDVWVSGSYSIIDSQNQLVYLPLFLHWNGSAWSQFESPGFGSDLVAIESNNVYAVGGETLVHWDGQSWSVAGVLDATADAALNAIDQIPGTEELVAAGWQGFPQDTLVARLTLQSPSCDFSGEGVCDVTDLDLMQSLGPIDLGVSATGLEQFDLNGDGTLDLADRNQWLAEAASHNGFGSPYKLGDANLDGLVDGQDFLAWNSAKFTSSLLWSDGNFNADGFLDGQDFIAWNGNKFTSSDGASAVPEPAAAMLVFITIILPVAAKRGR